MGALSQDYSTTQKAPKPSQDKEDAKQNMRGLKVTEWTTHNYTSANTLSHRFIGASLSEPHTSESNGGFFIYYILLV